jgi:hypothetical protein
MNRLLSLNPKQVRHLYRPKAKRRRARKDKQAAKDKTKIPSSTRGLSPAWRSASCAKPPSPETHWHFDDSKFSRAERVIKAIFYACVVSKSMELGLIDLDHLFVAGDGSKLRTWANPNGRKRCSYDNKGKKPDEWCNCEPVLSDRQGATTMTPWPAGATTVTTTAGSTATPTLARTGYELTSYSLDHTFELPLVILMTGNNRHDSVLSLYAMLEGRDILGFPIQVASFDKASDALGMYHLGYEL